MTSNTTTSTPYEWPDRAKAFGTVAPEVPAHPYDACAGFNDPDSGLETEPVLPHAWPPLSKKLAGGISVCAR